MVKPSIAVYNYKRIEFNKNHWLRLWNYICNHWSFLSVLCRLHSKNLNTQQHNFESIVNDSLNLRRL